MEKNFRSTDNIVNLASQSISLNTKRLNKTMVSSKIPTESNSIIIKGLPNQYQEIVSNIKELILENIELTNIAILVRKRKHIELIRNELSKNAISYVNNGMEILFRSIDHTLFKSIFICLENLERENLSCWKEYIEFSNLQKMFRYIRKSGTTDENKPFEHIFQESIKISNYLDINCKDFQIRKSYYDSFMHILKDFDEIYSDYSLTLKTREIVFFIEYMFDEMYKYQELVSGEALINGVQILTVHKAKGLEFDAVFIPNMNKGEFPTRNFNGFKKYYSVLKGDFELNKSQFETDIEDERNLFYVAVTRAKKYLYLYYDNTKKASQFLDEIDYI